MWSELAHLRDVRWNPARQGQRQFFRRAFFYLHRNGIDGDYAEFGCWTGFTFAEAFRESRRVGVRCRLWAFDSFQGLPQPRGPEDRYPGWDEGAMHMPLAQFRRVLGRHGVPQAEYEVVPGYYDRTLREDGRPLPTNICLAYVDCDLYTSAKTVLEFLSTRLKHGMIIAFDDYYCYTKDQVSGERRAAAEVFADNRDWRLVPYVQYGWSGMSFVVESRQLGCAF